VCIGVTFIVLIRYMNDRATGQKPRQGHAKGSKQAAYFMLLQLPRSI